MKYFQHPINIAQRFVLAEPLCFYFFLLYRFVTIETCRIFASESCLNSMVDRIVAEMVDVNKIVFLQYEMIQINRYKRIMKEMSGSKQVNQRPVVLFLKLHRLHKFMLHKIKNNAPLPSFNHSICQVIWRRSWWEQCGPITGIPIRKYWLLKKLTDSQSQLLSATCYSASGLWVVSYAKPLAWGTWSTR